MKISLSQHDGSYAKRKPGFCSIFLICTVLLVFVFYLAICFGAADTDLKDIYDAFFNYDSANPTHEMLRNIRLPRVLSTFMIGAGFALAGVMMQGITHNPLADSGLLGINSGASFMLALCFSLIPDYSFRTAVLFSFAGAAMGVCLTYLMAYIHDRRIQSADLVLAGVTISLLFTALSQLLGYVFGTSQQLSFWYIGGVANTSFTQLQDILPFFILAVTGGIILSPYINIIALGEESAVSLGVPLRTVKSIAIVVVFLSAGISVSLVGPISFIGLIVPHMIRLILGNDYRMLIPLSVICGGIVVMAADLIGRVVNSPYETPLGIIFSVIGVPVFLILVRRERAL